MTDRQTKKESIMQGILEFASVDIDRETEKKGNERIWRLIGGFSRADISEAKRFQQELRDILDRLIPNKKAVSKTLGGRWEVPGKSLRIILTSIPDGRGGYYIEDWRQPVSKWLIIAECLKIFGSRLRRCKECDTVYLKIKKQKYCSSKCSQRVMARNFYKRHKEEIKAERRKAYLEEKRKELGSKVKIREYRRYSQQDSETASSTTTEVNKPRQTRRRMP